MNEHLAELVEDLLMHQMDKQPLQPDFVVITDSRDGWCGVALVIDGWYARESDATEVIDCWRPALERLRAAMRAQAEIDAGNY